MESKMLAECGKYEDTVRLMIHRENEIIHQRLTWCITIQGFLFAAIGFSWDKAGNKPFILLICVLGFLLSLILFFTMAEASRATRRLLDWWDTNKPQDYNGPGVIGGAPHRSGLPSWSGPWTYIAIIFALSWIAVWLIKNIITA